MHRVFCYAGLFFWAISVTCMTITTFFASLAKKVDENSEWGNCWSYALPRWAEKGGYLLVRPADGNTFLGIFPVPHVIWVKSLPKHDVVSEQFFPVERKKARWWPSHTLYYKGGVKTREYPHNAID